MQKFTSVTNLFSEIKFGLETQYYLIQVTGEVSKITTIQKGNIFFDIKDENHTVSCFAIKQHIIKFKHPLKEGTNFNITGKLTIFKGSKINILVYGAEYIDIGLLEKSHNELFLKLQKEGYFLQDHKKQIKNSHNAIGLITAKQGAVIHDIINRLEERFPKKIFLYNSQMQGLDSIQSILTAINYFNLNFINKIDAILLARGGGSTEDLNIFNSEKLVKGIFNSKIPIISAIGHTKDKTLTDLVADFSTSTPTSAAEYLSKITRKDYHNSLNSLKLTLRINQNNILLFYSKNLKSQLQRLINFKNHILLNQNNILNVSTRIFNTIQKILFHYQIKIEKNQQKIIPPTQNLTNKLNQISFFKNKSTLNINNLIQKKLDNINYFNSLNNNNNINSTLQKGYSILTNENNTPITSIKSLKQKEKYFIHLKDGKKEIIVAD